MFVVGIAGADCLLDRPKRSADTLPLLTAGNYGQVDDIALGSVVTPPTRHRARPALNVKLLLMRGNIALGAIDAMVELLQGQAPVMRIDPQKPGYLMTLVQGAVRDAIPSYDPLHREPCNDIDD